MFEHESSWSVQHAHITHIASICVCVCVCCNLPQGQKARHGKITLSELQAQVIYTNVPWNELESLNTNTHTHTTLCFEQRNHSKAYREQRQLSERCTCSNPVEESVCVASPHSPLRWRTDKLHNHQQNNKPLRTKCLVWLNFLPFPSVSMWEEDKKHFEEFFGKIYLSNITRQDCLFWVSAQIRS